MEPLILSIWEPLIFPIWARRVVMQNHAIGLHFLMVKRIEGLDLSKEHNCIHLHEEIMQSAIVPYLTIEEIEKANLSDIIVREKKNECNKDNEDYSPRSNARMFNDGLNVSVYVQGGWRLELLLTRWNGNGSPVLIGTEMELCRILTKFQEGDDVKIWLFRRPDNNNEEKLCFMLMKAYS